MCNRLSDVFFDPRQSCCCSFPQVFNVAAVDCLAKTRKPASLGKTLAKGLFPSRRCVTATRRAGKDARARQARDTNFKQCHLRAAFENIDAKKTFSMNSRCRVKRWRSTVFPDGGKERLGGLNPWRCYTKTSFPRPTAVYLKAREQTNGLCSMNEFLNGRKHKGIMTQCGVKPTLRVIGRLVGV